MTKEVVMAAEKKLSRDTAQRLGHVLECLNTVIRALEAPKGTPIAGPRRPVGPPFLSGRDCINTLVVRPVVPPEVLARALTRITKDLGAILRSAGGTARRGGGR
jgi:hypothetical protein